MLKKPLVVRDGHIGQIKQNETLVSSSVVIGTDSVDIDPSAALEIRGEKGMLAPRMDTATRDAIANPKTGLLIFNTETGQHEEFAGQWRAVGEMPNPIDCGTF